MEYSDSPTKVEQLDPKEEGGKIVLLERETPIAETSEVQEFPPISQKLNFRRLILLTLFGASAIALSIIGLRRWQYAQSYEESNQAYVTNNTAAVYTRIPGKVLAVKVKENQSVKKGSILATINSQEYETKLRQAQANLVISTEQARVLAVKLDIAKQNLQKNTQNKTPQPKFDASILQAFAKLKIAQIHLRQFETQFIQSELDYQRISKLNQAGFATIGIVNQAKSKYDNNLKQRQKLLEQIKIAETKVSTTQQNVITLEAKKLEGTNKQETNIQKPDISQQVQTKLQQQNIQQEYEISRLDQLAAKNAIAQAEKQLKAARYQLASTKIVSPIDGKVNIVRVQAGDKIKQKQHLIALEQQKPWITANFASNKLKNIRPGQNVQIKINSLPNQIFTGKVQKILSPNKLYQSQIPIQITFNTKPSQAQQSKIIPGVPATVKVQLN
jgi:membrane fusion protein, multidrug efflux system